MDNAPIDIRYNELLKWLVERFVIPKDWTIRLEAINVKKQEIMDELYTKDTAEFKKIQESFKNVRNDMTYTDIMRLNQILLKTEEAKNKTFFGSYNSNLIKNIVLLVNLYEKNLMHLCESSKLIVQNIGYDITNFEKTIQSNDKSSNEISSKIQEKNLAISKNDEKLNGLFKLYNIRQTDNTNDIALNIIERLVSLPKHLDNINTMLVNEKITKIIKAYKNFYKKLNGKEIDEKNIDFLNTLQKINLEGDYILTEKNENKNIDKKSKYLIITKKLEDYKLKYQTVNVQADLDNDMWNLKLIEQSDKTSNYTTALLDSKTRNKLIDDLNELLIFIKHRLDFCNSKDEISLSIYQNSIRDINLEVNQDFLKESKKTLEDILKIFYDREFEFLSNIFEDEKKIKNILNSFESVKTENNNLLKNINELNNKTEELQKESIDFNKKIQQIKKDSKNLKKIMEKTLTDKMKRKITIIGDINLL